MLRLVQTCSMLCTMGVRRVGPGGESPWFEQHSVHGEAEHREHRGPDARPQPEGRVLQVCLAYMSVNREERRKYRNMETLEQPKR